MVCYGYSAFALIALRAVGVIAQNTAAVDDEIVKEAPVTPNIAVSVSASFPAAEVFGIKLVNNHATKAVLDFTNNEASPITISVIGGVLSTLQQLPANAPASMGIVRNLTAAKYDVEIPAGEKMTLPYSFATELHPQDLRLQIVAVLQKGGVGYQVQAFNETVTVVEAPTSLFDPQIIFLYLVLLSAFAGTLYYVYRTWIETLFPQTKRGGKGGERARRSVGGSKKAVAPEDQISVVGADGPAVTTGAIAKAAYDESWIPEHHKARPVAKRVKSGASKKKVVD